MERILVVVDMQNDFITGALGTPEARAIVPRVKEKIQAAHDNGDLVICTFDTHHANYLKTVEGEHLPVEHCILGTEGHKLVPELDEVVDNSRDVIIQKPTFGSTDMVDQINRLMRATTDIEVEFVGVCTGICVIANAVLAKTYFYKSLISVDASACACVTPESNRTALDAMKLLQINVKNDSI